MGLYGAYVHWLAQYQAFVMQQTPGVNPTDYWTIIRRLLDILVKPFTQPVCIDCSTCGLASIDRPQIPEAIAKSSALVLRSLAITVKPVNLYLEPQISLLVQNSTLLQSQPLEVQVMLYCSFLMNNYLYRSISEIAIRRSNQHVGDGTSWRTKGSPIYAIHAIDISISFEDFGYARPAKLSSCCITRRCRSSNRQCSSSAV